MPPIDESHLARARQLHCDNPVILIHDHDPIADDAQERRDANIGGKILSPVVDVFVDANPSASVNTFDGWTDHALREFKRETDALASESGGGIIAASADDFRRAHREGKFAVMLASEGGKLLEGSLSRFDDLYAAGLRSLQIAWNISNQLIQIRPDAEPMLTDFGREVIPELQRRGVIVDAMHAGRAAYFDILHHSSKPILLSHGGVQGAMERARHPGYERGLFRSFIDDDMLRSQAQTGGLLGISLYGPLFYWNNGCDINLEDVADHFQYVAETVGPDVLALGPDFFPVTGGWKNFGINLTRDQFVVQKHDLPRLTAHLLARGWRDEDVIKVIGGNFLRFYERVMAK